MNTYLRRMMAVATLLGLGLINAAAQTKFTSVYTDMKRDCKVQSDPALKAQGSDPPGVCKGYGGYRISVGYSAWSASFAVEKISDPNEFILLGEDYGGYGARGEKVEWRLVNDKPFAVIIRLGKYKATSDGGDPFAEANRTGSRLIIKGLKGFEQIDFEVDGATPNANQKARDMADNNYLKN